jgi:hypothetical protein
MTNNLIQAGRDGSSLEKAVIINATSLSTGIPAEYAYIEQVCGKPDSDYIIEIQTQISQAGRDYDVLSIKMKDGTTRDFWFDITSFFGKF